MNMIQSSVKWKWWRLCYAGECAAALCRHSGHAAEAMHCLCYALTLYAWSISTVASLHGLWCGTCSSQQAHEHDMRCAMYMRRWTSCLQLPCQRRTWKSSARWQRSWQSVRAG